MEYLVNNGNNLVLKEDISKQIAYLETIAKQVKEAQEEIKTGILKEMEEKLFVDKLQGVFRPDGMKIGRLVML